MFGMCDMYELFLKLIPGQKLCAACRKYLPIWLREEVEQTEENEYVTDDENYDDSEYTEVQEINTSMQINGESHVKLARKRYARTKLRRLLRDAEVKESLTGSTAKYVRHRLYITFTNKCGD
jgi:hypothetical protein